MQISAHDDCPLCRNKKEQLLIQNELAYAVYDTNPVNPGHCLIMPHRHVAEYFHATVEEKTAIWSLVDKMKEIVDQKHSPDGYNVGVNVGKLAGQSVPHIHIHMIPRYKGDVEDPKGGVRGVVPDRQKYGK